MRLEWIEDILAVYDTGSLREAAAKRLLTASAFTRRIKTLEEAVGGDIFDRSKKPVVLRPHVIELIPRLRETAAEMREIHAELSGSATRARVMRLVCQHTLSVSWAPSVARVLAEDGPRLRIRSGSRDECGFSVLKNDSDLALVYDDPNEPIDESFKLFDRFQLGAEEFVPVAALKENEDLQAAIKAKNIPLVIYPRSLFLGEMLEKVISRPFRQELNLTTVAEAGLGPAVFEFVRAGFGVGWLPRSMITAEIASGELQVMDELLPSFCLDVIALKSRTARDKSVDAHWKRLKSKFDF